MAMLFARASLPAWVVVLALAAFLAPSGVPTTVLLVVLCLVWLPAVIRAGIWRRRLQRTEADEPVSVIDVTPVRVQKRLKERS